MKVFNARRHATLEILTGMDSSCIGFNIARDPATQTAGEVLCSNSKRIPDGWWLLRYLHRCRDGGMMEEWFRTADDMPNETGNHLVCRSCGLVGLTVEDYS